MNLLDNGSISNEPVFQVLINVLHIFIERIVFPLLHLGVWLIIFWVSKSTHDNGPNCGSKRHVEKDRASSIDLVNCPKNPSYSSEGQITKLSYANTSSMHTTYNRNNNANNYDFKTEESEAPQAATTVNDDVSTFSSKSKQPDDLGELIFPESNPDHTDVTHCNIPVNMNPAIDSPKRDASPNSYGATKSLEMLPEAICISSEKHPPYPQTLEKLYLDRVENDETEFHLVPDGLQLDAQFTKDDNYFARQLRVSEVPPCNHLTPDNPYLSEAEYKVAIHTDEEYVFTEKNSMSFKSNAISGADFQLLNNDSFEQESYEYNLPKSKGNIPSAGSGESSMEQYHTLCQRLLETSSFLEPETTDDRFSMFHTSLNTAAGGQTFSSLEFSQSYHDTDDLIQKCKGHNPSNQSYDQSMECNSYIYPNHTGIADDTEGLSRGWESREDLYHRSGVQLQQKTHRDQSRVIGSKGRSNNVAAPELITQNIKQVDDLYQNYDPQTPTGSHSDRTKVIQCQTPNCAHTKVLHPAHTDAHAVVPVANTNAHRVVPVVHMEENIVVPVTHTGENTMVRAAHTNAHRVVPVAHTEVHTVVPVAHTEAHTMSHVAHTDAHTVVSDSHTGAQHMKKFGILENLSDPERKLEKVPLLYQLLVASIEIDQRELMSEIIKTEEDKIRHCVPDDIKSSYTGADLAKEDHSNSQMPLSNDEGREPERCHETVCDPSEEPDTQGTSSRATRTKGVTKIPDIPMDLDFVYMSCDTGKLVPVKDFIKILETCYLGVEEKKDIVYKQYIIAREKCCLDWIEAIRNRGKKILPKWWLHRNLRVEGLESNKCRKRREWLEKKQAQALEEEMLREKKDLIFLGTKPDISAYLDLPDGPDSLLFQYSDDGCPMFKVEQYFDAVWQSGVKDRLTNIHHSELNEGLPSRWQPVQISANQDFPSEFQRDERLFRHATCSNFSVTNKSELVVEDGRGDSLYES